MFALTSKPAVAAAKVRVLSDRKKISAHAHRATSVPRRGLAVVVKATADDKNGPSRRDILSAPGLAALVSAAVPAEQLWLPGMASAKGKGGIKPTNVTGFDDSIAAAKLGPIGGAVPCSDYKAWEKTIYGFIDGIKTGECPPAFKTPRARSSSSRTAYPPVRLF